MWPLALAGRHILAREREAHLSSVPGTLYHPVPRSRRPLAVASAAAPQRVYQRIAHIMPWDGSFTLESCCGIGTVRRKPNMAKKQHGPIMRLLLKVPLYYKSPKFIKVDEPPVSGLHDRRAPNLGSCCAWQGTWPTGPDLPSPPRLLLARARRWRFYSVCASSSRFSSL